MRHWLAVFVCVPLGCSGDLSAVGRDGGPEDRGEVPVEASSEDAVVIAEDRVAPRDLPEDTATLEEQSAEVFEPSDSARADAMTDAVAPTDASKGMDVPRDSPDVVAADASRDLVMELALGMDTPRDVPRDVAPSTDSTVAMDLPRDLGADLAMDLPRDLGADLAMDLPRDLGVDLAMDLPRDLGVDLAMDLPRDFGADLTMDVPRDLGVDTPRDVPRDLGVDLGVDVRGDLGGFPPVDDDTVSYSGTFPARTGRFTATLTVAGERRTVDLFVPAGGGSDLPLVLLFHGTNGAGSQIMTDLNAQSLANANGFVVAAPTSRFIDRGDFDHPTAETYWETFPNVNPDTNPDVLLARAIMIESQRVYATDPSRVYALGHSSGGFFTILLISTLQDRIAAFVENSAGLVPCATTSSCRFRGNGATCEILSGRSGFCTCSGVIKPNDLPSSGRQPAGYLVHGNDDPLVSVYYTCQLLFRMNALGWEAELHMREGDGHDLPTNLLRDAWPFLSAHLRM